MNENQHQSLKQRLLEHLRSRDALRSATDDVLVAVIDEWILAQAPAPDALPSPEVLDTLAARVLARAKLSAEERSVRARLAAQLGSSLADLDAIVQRQFEGATRDIATRHSQAVRLDRTRRVIEAVLYGLGGQGATLEQVLAGAGRAVTLPVLEVFGQSVSADLERRLRNAANRALAPAEVDELLQLLRQRQAIPTAEPAAIGQVAQAASQAVQQAAVNVQKILTVALEADRSGDKDGYTYYP
jgi:hypothetical protein